MILTPKLTGCFSDTEMKKRMDILALIPARSGSKRLPGKNTRTLWGKPLLAYSIETALNSRLVSRVICSTDDPNIAAIAQKHGAEVPFLRPVDLSQDLSADIEFYMHALTWLKRKENYVPDIVANFRPTNPLRRVEVVDDVLKKLIERNDADSVRTIHRSPVSVFLLRTIRPDTGFLENPVVAPRVGPHQVVQHPLPVSYSLNAYLDATWTEAVLRTNTSLGFNMLPYLLDEEPIDLDTETDWHRLIESFHSYGDYLDWRSISKGMDEKTRV